MDFIKHFTEVVNVMASDIELSKKSVKAKQLMQDNPDLPYEFVCQLMIAQAEVEADRVEPFYFG